MEKTKRMVSYDAEVIESVLAAFDKHLIAKMHFDSINDITLMTDIICTLRDRGEIQEPCASDVVPEEAAANEFK